MWCSECGTELLNEAKFCFNCSTKVKKTNSTESDDLNNEVIIKEYDDSKAYCEFNIGGSLITLPKDTDHFIFLKLTFDSLAKKAYLEFEEARKTEFYSIENMLSYCKDNLSNYYTMVFSYIDDYANEFKLRGFSKAIENYIDSNCSTFLSLIEAIESRYYEILDAVEEAQEYRRYRKQARGKWVGGGFGISGAITGALEAGAINAVTGATHALANGVGNISTKSQAKSQIEKLYKDKELLDQLGENLYNDVMYIKSIVVQLGYDQYYIDMPNLFTREDEEEALKIYNQLDEMNNQERSENLIEMFRLYPFYEEMYVKALVYYPNQLKGLSEYAQFFGINYDVVQKEALERREFINKIKELYGENALIIESQLKDNCIYKELVLNFDGEIDSMARNICNICAEGNIDYISDDITPIVEARVFDAFENYADFSNDNPLILYTARVTDDRLYGLLITEKYLYFQNSDNENIKFKLSDIESLNIEENTNILIINDIRTNLFLDQSCIIAEVIEYIVLILKYSNINTQVYRKINYIKKYYNEGIYPKGSLEKFDNRLNEIFNKNRYYHKIKGELNGNINNDLSVILRNFDFEDAWCFLNEVPTKVFKKLENAQHSYASITSDEVPIILHDSTVFGGAKEGFLITNKMVYSKGLMAKPVRIDINSIKEIKFKSEYIKIDEMELAFKSAEGERRKKFRRIIEVLLIRLAFEKYLSNKSEFTEKTNVDSNEKAKLSDKVEEFMPSTNQKFEKVKEDSNIDISKEKCLEEKTKEPNIDLNKIIDLYNKSSVDIKKSLYLNEDSIKIRGKFTKAKSSYAQGIQSNEIEYLLFDNTVFGGAKDGFLITNKTIYWHSIMEKPKFLELAQIKEISINKTKILINNNEIAINTVGRTKIAELANLIIDIINILRNNSPN